MTLHFHTSDDAEYFTIADAWRAVVDELEDRAEADRIEAAGIALGAGTVEGLTVTRCTDPDCWVLDLYGYAN